MPGQMYALNAPLAQWAFNLTRNTPLDDSDQLKEIRGGFDGAASQRPPFVGMGDEISSSTYWHGKLMDEWAAEWMRYFTGGKGEFATTAMEDTGTLQSLEFLANAGRVDLKRVLVLRTVSNFDRQPRGLTAAESLARQRIGKYAAYLPSLEAAYRVGHVVVSELLDPLAAIRAERSRSSNNSQSMPAVASRRMEPTLQPCRPDVGVGEDGPESGECLGHAIPARLLRGSTHGVHPRMQGAEPGATLV